MKSYSLGFPVAQRFSVTIVFLLTIFSRTYAEDMDVQLIPSQYAGGYNISCHGANNGSVLLFISGGNAPYSFLWNDGSTLRNRSNLTAGYYKVLVRSANGMLVKKDIYLKEPEGLSVSLFASDYKGNFQISESGAADGAVKAEIFGGIPPYNISWSNGESRLGIENLSAGNYSVLVEDAGHCLISDTIELHEPTPLTINSISSPFLLGTNFNVSACNKKDGSIFLNVSGGSPPYSFRWSNGEFTQNLDHLEAGRYSVIVSDANDAEATANILLIESPEVDMQLIPLVFSNGKNTSCYHCNNGSIQVSNLQGVAPFYFQWSSGQTLQNIVNLDAGDYVLFLRDALGCEAKKSIRLFSPDREDWTMNGNVNSNSSNHFLGTNDNQDLVFKTNGFERFRLMSSGISVFSSELKILNPSGKTAMVFQDGNGKLISSELSVQNATCGRSGLPIWNTDMNQNIIYTCSPSKVGIGTTLFPGATKFRVSGKSKFDGDIEVGDTLDDFLLKINGQLKLNSLVRYGKPILLQADSSGIIQPASNLWPSSFNYWRLDSANNNVFREQGKVGIGIINPSATLQVLSSNSDSSDLFKIEKQKITGTNRNVLRIKSNGELSYYNNELNGNFKPAFFISSESDGDVFAAKVGVGTDAPTGQFQVGHNLEKIVLGSFYDAGPFYNGAYIGFNAGRNKNNRIWTIDNDGSPNHGAGVITNSVNGEMRFITLEDSATGESEPDDVFMPKMLTDSQVMQNVRMVITADGKIGMGQPSSYAGNFRLYVKGGIITDRVKVATDGSNDWMDIVFDKDYKLLGIKELQKYIQSNKHLPEIPAAEEVMKDGFDLGVMQKKLLQKIEELTLYLIDQNKRIEDLENTCKY